MKSPKEIAILALKKAPPPEELRRRREEDDEGEEDKPKDEDQRAAEESAMEDFCKAVKGGDMSVALDAFRDLLALCEE